MSTDILSSIRRGIASERRIAVAAPSVRLQLAGDDVVAEGEVATVAAKRLTLEAIARTPGVSGVVDRLRVAPARPMGDREIRDHLRDALVQEPAFQDYAVVERLDGRTVTLRGDPEGARGTIEIHVAEGVVTLDGRVPGLDGKRLAGVLAWWVPGSRDVVNGIAVEPPEADSADAVAEAVRLVLEKDPFVDAGQIRVGVRDRSIRLEGLVPTAAEREMAEQDCWYLFGVDDVDNRIEVAP